MRHLALRQSVFDEHGIDSLEIELRRQVHYRQIFIIEVAVLFSRFAIVLHQMLIKFAYARSGDGRGSWT